MRSKRTLALVASVVGLGAVGAPAASARSSSCSPSGDFCQAIVTRHGHIYFELRTLGFGPVKVYLCVTHTAEVCHTYRLKRLRGGVYGRSVRWAAFPFQGHGVYRVRWYFDGDQLGKTLTF